MSRTEDLDRFYALLEELRQRLGGYRYLKDCRGMSGWPERGVYFFFEPGELREHGRDLRVVRIGTHALTANSRTTLWKRLSQHRGSTGGARPGGGNHRGSIFRLHVGTALQKRHPYPPEVIAQWGRGQSAPREVCAAEYPLEREVSAVIGAMPFLWLDVPDAPGPSSHRALIETNAVGLLSNHQRAAIDPPSPDWLGRLADRPQVRESGLWNVNFVEGHYSAGFLSVLADHVRRTANT